MAGYNITREARGILRDYVDRHLINGIPVSSNVSIYVVVIVVVSRSGLLRWTFETVVPARTPYYISHGSKVDTCTCKCNDFKIVDELLTGCCCFNSSPE
jgi:hypothetical protein